MRPSWIVPRILRGVTRHPTLGETFLPRATWCRASLLKESIHAFSEEAAGDKRHGGCRGYTLRDGSGTSLAAGFAIAGTGDPHAGQPGKRVRHGSRQEQANRHRSE